MLRTRLIVGTILAALTAGMLFLDRYFGPWAPFLGGVAFVLSILGTLELVFLLPENHRPILRVCLIGVIVVLAMNWLPLVRHPGRPVGLRGWECIAQGLAAMVLAAFLAEMARFSRPGGSVERIAITGWIIAYLGLLPCFLVQLRLSQFEANADLGAVALALTIFVPKGCDIGAYFTGRLLGRHRMTPTLSPKKTWEGAAGGLFLAIAIAFGLNSLGPAIPGGTINVILFGLTVGIAGMLGDLAESLIKRDCERKDASQAIPGFGGILDVVDSILFAAPVSYWWLS
jgi:phosphatidate cytidylyltransferase